MIFQHRQDRQKTGRRILRIFPTRTSMTPRDDLTLSGEYDSWPGLFRPAAEEVHISVVFTWDILQARKMQKEWRRYYPIVKLGGPAFGNTGGEAAAYVEYGHTPFGDVNPEFVPGKYVAGGVTFTTRGCNNNCPWCLVPNREGNLQEIEDFAEGHIIQDNNLLQASRQHIERVFAMLNRQKRPAMLSGGLDARLVDDWVAEQLRGLRLDQLFLAADTVAALKPLESALNKLSHLGRRKLRVYTMIGYDGETIEEATERLEAVWDLGGLPFAQLYQPPNALVKKEYDRDWRLLQRAWARPAAMFAAHNQGEDNGEYDLPERMLL